jgi:hypothetical protein
MPPPDGRCRRRRLLLSSSHGSPFGRGHHDDTGMWRHQYKFRASLRREAITGDGSHPARVHDAEDVMQVGTAISV